jgi:hypothetical protein
MRYELTDHEWAAIKPMLPNKPRGVQVSGTSPGLAADSRETRVILFHPGASMPNDIFAFSVPIFLRGHAIVAERTCPFALHMPLMTQSGHRKTPFLDMRFSY